MSSHLVGAVKCFQGLVTEEVKKKLQKRLKNAQCIVDGRSD